MNKSTPNWGDGWKAQEYTRPTIRKKQIVKPIEGKSDEEKMYEWFLHKRKITKETLDAAGIYFDTSVWLPQTEEFAGAISFPFYRNGELITIKYSGPKKMFWL